MSNLTDLLPAGGGGKGVDFVASGALSNGSTVVLKADGTVEVAGESSSTITYTEDIPYGGIASVDVSAGWQQACATAFDPNNSNRFVIIFQASATDDGIAYVGTISGTNISFGSQAVFSGYAKSGYYGIDVAFDPNDTDKFVVITPEVSSSNYGKAWVGTISGTSISFGAAATFNSGGTAYTRLAFDPNTAGKFVVAYRDDANSYYGTAVVGTISGTSITFGSEYVFRSSYADNIVIAFDPNTPGKFVIFTVGSYGTLYIGTISGTSLSFSTGTTNIHNNIGIDNVGISFDPNNAGKFVIAYKHGYPSTYYAITRIGTVSGSSITLGTEYKFDVSLTVTYLDVAFSGVDSVILAYRADSTTDYGMVCVGEVSGDTITFGEQIIINSVSTQYLDISCNSINKNEFIVGMTAQGDSGYGKVIQGKTAGSEIITTTNLTADNFLGISDAAVSDTATGTITLKGGISTNQSGLTIGSDYYVQDDGTLSTTVSSVKAGRALSATTLKLTGE